MIDRLFDPFLRRLLHPPNRPARPLPPELRDLAEDVTIERPGLPLKAWLVKPKVPAAAVAVFIHGWSSDGGRMAALAGAAVARGIAVLLVDLPGHGRTGPVATYNARLMVDDIRGVRDWVAVRTDLAALRVGLLGFSFGGVGAYVSAARDPRWSALVVMAAPLGPMQATRLYLDGKGLPGKFLVGMLRRSTIRLLGVDPDDYSGERTLPALRVPAMIVHGERDEVVPVAHGQGLAAFVPDGLGTLFVVPGADHTALGVDPVVASRVAGFLFSSLAEGRR